MKDAIAGKEKRCVFLFLTTAQQLYIYFLKFKEGI
jgi:hypothetical protein